VPYITKQAKVEIDGGRRPVTAGELNYVITRTMLQFLEGQTLSYDSINDTIGAVEAAKQEFYRRIAIPYEDKKIAENGDVY
jgi:hypothetical protein